MENPPKENKPKKATDRYAGFAKTVLIKDSLILDPSGKPIGKGAFSTVRIPKGVIVGQYMGKEITQEEAENSTSDYILETDRPKRWLDAEDPAFSNWTRYVNQCPKGKRNNLIITPSGKFKTIKVISPGSEFYVCYGRYYWKNAERY